MNDQNLQNNTDREALIAELDLHKTEYSTLRQEILQLLESQRQYLNLNLVAIAAILGVVPFIIQQQAFVVFLYLPVIFYILLGEMVSSIRSVKHLSSYIANSLIPRVNIILDELGDNRRSTIVLGWEISVKTHIHTRSRWLIGSFQPSRYWVPVLTAAALIIAYILNAEQTGRALSLQDVLLILLNLVLLILAASTSVALALSEAREAKALRERDFHHFS